jgi:hypothetical protein
MDRGSYYLESRTKFVTSTAACAALYAVTNALTSFIHTPWGVGEFRIVIVPAFFALVSGPLSAAVGGAVGSFLGDLVLQGTGGTNLVLNLTVGVPANFVGPFLIGWIFQKVKNWRGFIAGSVVGLFVGNLIAAAGVVFVLGALGTRLPDLVILGLLLFWFGTMFPVEVIAVPPIIRALRPWASKLSSGDYPVINEPDKRSLWAWTATVTIIVLAGVPIIFLLSTTSYWQQLTGVFSESPPSWVWAMLFALSALAVVVMAGLVNKLWPQKRTVPQVQK